ncbi:MAG: lipopolysaccharide biosynthesis [Acidobacteriaceae bacterium]|nr:lipopolysaccharide biosynthesis [Acidobacteriaceae bacterium]
MHNGFDNSQRPQSLRREIASNSGGTLGYNLPLPRQGESRNPSLIADYFHTLSRWRGLILLSAVIGLGASFLLTLTSLPVFRARTSLEIQSINGDFMDMRAVAPTGGGASGEQDVQTQIKLLQSDSLRERVVDYLQKEKHPESIERNDLLSNLKRGLHISRSEPLAYDDLIAETAKSVTVKPLGVTRLVEITCDSWSSDFASRFCNAMVSQYREADQETRSSEASKISDWLTRQVADVKLKAEESQHRLEEATGGNGLVLSQQSNSVGEDRLRQIQGELVRSQADRMEKEAQAGLTATSSSDTLPNVLDSPTYRSYEQKLAELKTSVAQLVPPLTEENPKVIHLRSQIREVEAGMARERSVGNGRMKNEYEAARHREALLMATYRAAEAAVSSDLGKASKINLLRREVESEQQLYQTLLQRAREAGFASAMQTTTIRTVDAAQDPKVPISPRRGTNAGAGFLVGAIFGIGFSFFKERNSEVFRVPGDIQKRLRVQELGVIPSSDAGRKNVMIRAIHSKGSLSLKSDAEKDTQGPIGLTKWNANDFSISAEAYRSTTFSILLSDHPRSRARMYVVSSPNAGEGKTTVSSNLGVALSKSKLKVLLVDGDLRKPGLHKALQMENNFGLRNILRGEIDIQRAPLSHFCQPTSMANLSVLLSGTGREEVVELLHSPDVRTLLTRLSHEFDVVLIDTPPMLHMTDARIFSTHADGAILVFRAGVTTQDQAGAAVDLFEHDRVPLIGTILNDFDPIREGKASYYDSYYRYRQQTDGVEESVMKL